MHNHFLWIKQVFYTAEYDQYNRLPYFYLTGGDPILHYDFRIGKMQQEQNSSVHIGDSFKKIIVVKDRIKLWRNEQGIVVIGIMYFLLNPNSLDL